VNRPPVDEGIERLASVVVNFGMRWRLKLAPDIFLGATRRFSH